MMNNHRFNGNSNNNRHQFDAATPNSSAELFLRSESPRVQQILLHQQLREDIERNSTGRVRYVDSELYLRNNERSPTSSGAPEAQGRTCSGDSTSRTSQNLIKTSSSPRNRKVVEERTSKGSEVEDDDAGATADTLNNSKQQQQRQQIVDKNCQVCLIREVRQDLMNINRMVQERNEQLTKKMSKLKAKCLRSYFERQMMD